MPHPLTTHGGLGDLDATALTDDAFESDALVLSTRALPVAGGSEDLLTEQTVLLRLQSAVVDRLWLLDLAVRPIAHVVRGGQTNPDFVKRGCFEHAISLLSLSKNVVVAV